MADIVGAIVKMLVEELDQNSSNSEAVQTKIGGNINGLIDRRYSLKVDAFGSNTSWVCPAGVTSVVCVGCGGGGGGAEGGYFPPGSGVRTSGRDGTDGGNTLFNGTVVGPGGERGGGNGVHGAGGQTITGRGVAAPSAPGFHWFGGGYGFSGTGGGWVVSPPGGTIPYAASGGPGKVGVTTFNVTPGSSYTVEIGGGGSGGDGLTNAGGGGAGGAGILLVAYILPT